jgi:hypothetical protein
MGEENNTKTLFDFGLFTGAPQHDNFCRLHELCPVSKLEPSTKPYIFPAGEELKLPETYTGVDGKEHSVEALISDTCTGALFVLHDGKVALEKYWLTSGPSVPWLSMSVAKSFTSTLVGIAHAEGLIKSLDEPISNYVKVTPGSAYDGVPIRVVLRMSSGARWNEDYSDPKSDIAAFGAAARGVNGGSLDEFIANMVREAEPDTVCRYNSAETQVLGALSELARRRC